MKITKSGIRTTKTSYKLLLTSFLFITSHLNAQSIYEAPLINLDELKPSYDEDIIGPERIDKTNVNGLINTENKNTKDPYATVSMLNKITAEVRTIEIELKENYLFEDLKIYAIDCYNSEPLEKMETAVYLNIYNRLTNDKIFNGWMIKSLPSVSSMEHPIYDLWVEDCNKL